MPVPPRDLPSAGSDGPLIASPTPKPGVAIGFGIETPAFKFLTGIGAMATLPPRPPPIRNGLDMLKSAASGSPSPAAPTDAALETLNLAGTVLPLVPVCYMRPWEANRDSLFCLAVEVLALGSNIANAF